MPFRLWFYATKVGFPVLFICGALSFIYFRHSILFAVSIGGMILLGLVGAVMGIMMVFGKLLMRCPFCGRPGPVGGTKSEGMWMDCDACGHIHGGGLLRLRIVRDEPDQEGPRDDGPEADEDEDEGAEADRQ